VRSRILGVAALGSAALVAGNADAFCRTTTTRPPAGYDPAVSGCWTQGKPIAWLWDERISYELAAGASRQVDLADATRAADRAFAQWNQVECVGGPPNVTAFDDGPVAASGVAIDCRSIPCDPTLPGDYHLIVFRDDRWDEEDPVNTLALTTITYAAESGVLFNAEIEINSHDHRLATREPIPRGAFWLEAILTHEAGHFLGLAHATDRRSIMYAYYTSGSTELTPDDVAGICATYPPQPRASHGSCAVGPGAPLRPPLAVGAAILGLACLHRRRSSTALRA
jgi:MYXO-CTERM domain-containing protein